MHPACMILYTSLDFFCLPGSLCPLNFGVKNLKHLFDLAYCTCSVTQTSVMGVRSFYLSCFVTQLVAPNDFVIETFNH